MNPDLTSLWQAKADGDPDARAALITRHLHLVRLTRERTVPNVPGRICADDLEGDGALALIRAVDQFDPERGVKFTSYAITMIRGALLEHLRSEDWTPRSVRMKQQRISAAYASLAALGVLHPTLADLAEELGLDPDSAGAYLAAGTVREVVSLEDSGYWDEEMGDLIVSARVESGEPDPCEVVIQREEARELRAAVDSLRPGWREAMRRYYYGGVTLKVVAKEIGRSESRAHQIHARSIAHLRARLGA